LPTQKAERPGRRFPHKFMFLPPVVNC